MSALCVVPVFAMAASLPSAPAAVDASRSAAQGGQSAENAPKAAAGSVADSHFLLQYALHRSSRYLYNPGDGAQLAGASGHVETVEH